MSAPDPTQDEFSLEPFLERMKPRLKALFTLYRIPPQDTEDILQQALLALVYQWQGIRDHEAWLVGTLRNKCLVYWRDHRRKLYDAVDAQVLEWVAKPLAPSQEDRDLERDLARFLERLPDRCQALLRLRYRLGFDPLEVAQQLGYSPSSISKVTTRCLSALIRQLTAAGMDRKKG